MAGFDPKAYLKKVKGSAPEAGAPLEAGNIDMNTRPRVKNADGSISTVRSISFSEKKGGPEILIPTVSDDGRILSDAQAIEQYRKTGKHLGKFASVADANAFADQLHQSEANKLVPSGQAPAAAFDPKAYLQSAQTPLEKAVAANPGAESYTIDTPTGPITVDPQGNEVKSFGDKAMEFDRSGRLKALSTLTSILQGTTGGQFAPQLLGTKEAAREALIRAIDPRAAREGTVGDVYRRTRADVKKTMTDATAQRSPEVLGIPVLPLVGAVASSGPLAETALGRIAIGSGLGGLYEAANSRADLTKGEVGDYLSDVKSGTIGGGIMSAGGEALSKVAGAVGGRVAREADKAREALAALKGSAAEKAAASALAKLRKNLAEQGVTFKNAAQTILLDKSSPGSVTKEALDEALGLVQSPEGQKWFTRAMANNAEKAKWLFGSEEGLRAALADATAANQPAAIEAATQAALKGAPREFGGRAWKSVGPRALLAGAGAGLGSLVSALTGHDWKKGAAGGAFGSTLLAHGGLNFLRNSAKNPAYQKRLLDIVAAGGGKTQALLRQLGRLAQPAASVTPPPSETDNASLLQALSALE